MDSRFARPDATDFDRTPSPDTAWRELHHAACAPYRGAGRFAWHFARGKLGRDPIFRALLERGDLPPHARIVDIGCGQGLLASLLSAAEAAARAGRWPAQWPAAPSLSQYTGIELMPRDVARAARAWANCGSNTMPTPRFICADMCQADLPTCDILVIFDVLHYADHAAQERLLKRVHQALRPNGRLLLRVGNADNRCGFGFSQWVDRTIAHVRGHQAAPTFGRSLAQWHVLLERLGFSTSSIPMSRGTPFANVLITGVPQ